MSSIVRIKVLENGACRVKKSSSTKNRGFYIMLHLMYSRTLSTQYSLHLDVAFLPFFLTNRHWMCQFLHFHIFSQPFVRRLGTILSYKMLSNEV